MKIYFTLHAKFRMQQRKILIDDVLETIKFPDKTIKKYDLYYYQKIIVRGNIEVVGERTEKGLKVVTVYLI